ncbi:MAG: RDD family protein, partial [Flavitalea sp.]
YHVGCEVAFNGQSVGKMLMKIRVITAEGGQPAISQYIIRWVFRLIDFPILLVASIASRDLPWGLFPLVFAGLACVIFTEKSQRIGDLLADTILIDLNNKTSWQDTVFEEVESDYTPRYPMVMQLSDRDINTLKSIIDSVRRKNDLQLALRIADRIKSKLSIDTEQESMDFLRTRLKDYNYYSSN